jgi:hypothetical protein
MPGLPSAAAPDDHLSAADSIFEHGYPADVA